ncbi:unnamed protein product [Toxocara canis]|uniref:RF_PROK_I domain-containing protein n=1 Tax=Toxocara canis TaxID=6265 RepID=A0A183U3T4_TOXCA|nr:unnamed protein product [Toxocara canis]
MAVTFSLTTGRRKTLILDLPSSRYSGRQSTTATVFHHDNEQSAIDAFVLPNDDKIETMRASGTDGQNVKKRWAAVRLVDKPRAPTKKCGRAFRVESLPPP